MNNRSAVTGTQQQQHKTMENSWQLFNGAHTDPYRGCEGNGKIINDEKICLFAAPEHCRSVCVCVSVCMWNRCAWDGRTRAHTDEKSK